MPTSDVRDPLTHGERLLIRAVRLLALGGCAGLPGHFDAACGLHGAETYRMLTAFVQQLSLAGRRRVRLSPPRAPALSADEAAILDVFGAAQADDYRTLDERLTALAGGPPPASLGAAACWVAEAFALNGLTLRTSFDAAATPVLYAAE